MFRHGIGGVRIRVWLSARSNAGTDMVEPYRAPARSYNYAPPPPPRPVVYVPPVRFGVAIGPPFGFYGPGSVFSVAAIQAAPRFGAVIAITGINQEAVRAPVLTAASVPFSDLPPRILFLFPEIPLVSVPDLRREDRIEAICATLPSSVQLLSRDPQRPL